MFYSFSSCHIYFFDIYSSLKKHSDSTYGRAREPRMSSKRKTWMNHGSHRGGPRKHLVNPTAEDSFQLAREFPV
jgi:hypothetical protein